MGFEWDSTKAESNRVKHGIHFSVAKRVFDDPLDVVIDVTRPDLLESRSLAIGQIDETLVTVVFTERGANRRLISARRSHRSERRYHPAPNKSE